MNVCVESFNGEVCGGQAEKADSDAAASAAIQNAEAAAAVEASLAAVASAAAIAPSEGAPQQVQASSCDVTCCCT